MASIRHKKGKARNTRPKHCKVCSSTTPLKLGLILSENALVTVSFWGHYHGQAAAQQKDSTMFYIWKDNSQHLLFSVLCTQGENWFSMISMPIGDVKCYTRDVCCLCKGDPCPMWPGSRTQGNAAGLTCATSAPSKGQLLTCRWLIHFWAVCCLEHNIYICLSFQAHFPG